MRSLERSRLRTPITIQQRGAGEDAAGQPNGEWETYLSTRADIRFPTGLGQIRAEQVAGGAEFSQAACSMRIRWITGITDGITHAMRVLVADGSDRIFDIRQVVPDIAGRQHVDLVCDTGASQG